MLRSRGTMSLVGLPPGKIVQPFTLSYKEPLPMPVQRYPLYWEPGGLRRCF